jgi:hypothetical protein
MMHCIISITDADPRKMDMRSTEALLRAGDALMSRRCFRLLPLLTIACAGLLSCSSPRAREGLAARGTASEAQALPVDLADGGDVSAIAAGDLDGDGHRDICALGFLNGKPAVIVGWGDAKLSFSKKFAHVLEDAVSLEMRQLSPHVVGVADLNQDGLADAVTSAGVLLGRGDRALAWRPLPGGAVNYGQPVAILSQQPPWMARATAAGDVEICEPAGACTPLANPYQKPGRIRDLVAADFDRDGYPDLLAGHKIPLGLQDFEPYAVLWRSALKFSKPVKIPGMDPIDMQVGDVDGDGDPDVLSQFRETMQDFPSTSQLWILGKKGFKKAQVIRNSQNHNDSSCLHDLNQDGCLDLLQSGVDKPQVAIRFGTREQSGACAYLGKHAGEVDVGWDGGILYPPEMLSGASGVQVVELRPGLGFIVLRSNRIGVDAESQPIRGLYLLPAKP